MKIENQETNSTNALGERRRERMLRVDARLTQLFRKAENDRLLGELRKLVRDYQLEKE